MCNVFTDHSIERNEMNEKQKKQKDTALREMPGYQHSLFNLKNIFVRKYAKNFSLSLDNKGC